MNLGARYDAVNTLLFLPAGGSARLRRALVDALEIRPGDRVLELGCGTGQVTEHLLAVGADVVAVDALPAMLEAAQRRAAAARYVNGDVRTVPLGGGFDHVVLSFLLHNLSAPDRVAVLRRAAESATDEGRLGILDWSLPSPPLRAALWRRVLGRLEPSSDSTREVAEGALGAELPAAGLRTVRREPVAGGRAELIVAAPDGRS